MFHVGQQVVALRGRGGRDARGNVVPTKGCIYTIREIRICPEAAAEAAAIGAEPVGLAFEEIVNAPMETTVGKVETVFVAAAFRPVVKTDISIFTGMLNKTPHDKQVDA